MKKKMRLFLEHAPSDKIQSKYNGYNWPPVDPPDLQVVDVDDVDVGQIEFCSYVGRNFLSGKNFTKNSGLIVDSEGKQVCRIAFSGDIRPIGKDGDEIKQDNLL